MTLSPIQNDQFRFLGIKNRYIKMIKFYINHPKVQKFWFWDNITHYLKFLSIFTVFMLFITLPLRESIIFHTIIGFASSGIEAMLGVP